MGEPDSRPQRPAARLRRRGVTLVEASVPAAAPMTEDEARQLVSRVRQLDGMLYTNLRKLYVGRGWIALGHATWEECCDVEFAGNRLQLTRGQRQAVVQELAAAGMSTRAMAAATGVSKNTVARDLRAGVPNGTPAEAEPRPPITGTDGKTYPAHTHVHEEPPTAPRVRAEVGEPAEPESVADNEIVDAEIIEEEDREERIEAVERFIEDDPDLQLMRWQAEFYKAVTRITSPIEFGLENVAAKADDEAIEDAIQAHDVLGKWLDQVQQQRPKGLHVIRGGAS